MKLFTLIICFLTFSAKADADAVFEHVASKSEYLRYDEQTEIKALGSLSNGYKIYNYRHHWNNGNRISIRIVAIGDNNELVGIYAVNDWASNLTSDCIVFPFPKDEGNSICLTDGKLPEQAWIDGENPALFK